MTEQTTTFKRVPHDAVAREVAFGVQARRCQWCGPFWTGFGAGGMAAVLIMAMVGRLT